MKNILIYGLLLISFANTSCKKYLDAKPNGNLSTPESVADLQGILDDSRDMNTSTSSNATDIASDDYFLTDTEFNALSNIHWENAYLWQGDIFAPSTDWNAEYTLVYRANVVLGYLPDIIQNNDNASSRNNCKGQALVFRAKGFYEIAQIWSKAYDKNTANTDLGIPLKLTFDYNSPTTRATVQQTYSQIISDLKAAIPLLPAKPVFVFRPSKASAYGYLARTYLAMRDYTNAGLYADSCIQINSNLQDYNALDSTATYPFAPIEYTNPEEVIFSSETLYDEDTYNSYASVDTNLFKSYAQNDLRRSIYFKSRGDGTYYYRGSYRGSYPIFNGITTDEMFLTRAECEARGGDTKDAMSDLNTLLVKRWFTGTFVPYAASDATTALNLILSERRKELLMRGLRFTDIKRLNKEGANIVQTRIVAGKTYTLQPNDPKYALPIPIDVIQFNHIQQNPGY